MNEIVLKTLVVDDEIGMRLGVERILGSYRCVIEEYEESVSFSVETADDGCKALEMLRANQYDLLVLDYKLPGMEGLEVLSSISKEKIPVQTIMVTAYASLEVAISATKFGAFDFLAKPFTPVELTSTIERAVRHIVLKRRAQRLEEEKRQVRFQFLSVLAHELKSPLAAVEGYLRLMDAKVSGDSVSSYGNAIGRSLNRIEGMRRMIMDLLDLTRIESGTKNRNLELLNLSDMLAVSVENFKDIAERRNIAIQLVVKDHIERLADRGELEIVFSNLVSNAVKYNRDGGKVVVSLEKQDGCDVVSVEDTGVGLSSDDISRLFKEFSRIKNERTKGIEGSGLGLSIVKKLVELNGGKISVDSTEGVGSKFKVAFQSVKN